MASQDHSRPGICYGYRHGKEPGTFVLDLGEALAVRMAFMLREQHYPLRRIAMVLANTGLPVPKTRWSKEGVHNILSHRDLYDGARPEYPAILDYVNKG